MTSKTFKSALDSPVTLEVEDASDVPGVPGVYLTVSQSAISQSTILLTPSDAPDLALAILEAAGVEARSIPSARIGTSEHLSDTAYELSTYIEKQQRATAEAKDQAELEAEALELFNANQGTDLDDWKYADRSVVSSWVRVARKAREMRAEK